MNFRSSEITTLQDQKAALDNDERFKNCNTISIVTSSKKNRKNFYLVQFSGNLFAFITGLSVTWSSAIIPKLQNATHPHNPFDNGISVLEASWICGFYAVGGIFGLFVARYVLVKFGRKRCILFYGGIPFIASSAVLLFSKTLYLYYLARFLMGIAATSIYTVMPMYNDEIAEPFIRDRICSFISTFEMFGKLMSYILGSFLNIFSFNIFITVITVFSTVLGFIVLPESPFYQVLKNDHSGATRALIRLRSTFADEVQEELELIVTIVEESTTSKGFLKKMFKSKSLQKAQLTIFGLLAFQIFSGFILIEFYSQNIFIEGGDVISPEYSSMCVGVMQLIFSFITPKFIDRLDRKPMLVISALGMFLMEFLLGLYYFLRYKDYSLDAFYWLPVTCIVMYIFSYMIGFGPLLWTIIGELFPSNIKSSAATLTCFVYWILVLFLSQFFNFLTYAFGIAMCFLFFAGFCLLSIVFVITYLVETKGKTVEEIQKILNK